MCASVVAAEVRRSTLPSPSNFFFLLLFFPAHYLLLQGRIQGGLRGPAPPRRADGGAGVVLNKQGYTRDAC